MPYSKAFGAWVKEVIGARSARDAAELVGVSHTTVAGMKTRGQIPRPRTLAQFSARLEISPAVRAQGFRLAGYRDPEIDAPEDERIREVPVEYDAPMLRGIENLTPEDRKLLIRIVRAFIDERG